MIKTNDKSLCCGCQACKIVCPQDCISFDPDAIGALYARINKDKCINCKKCEMVCPIQKKSNANGIGKEAFAAYANSPDIRYSGSSGGMFELVANEVIREGGSVFACRFDDKFQLRCVEATTKDEIKNLTKSKYLQSESAEMFPSILARIKAGKKVLFCSTPCQVAALKDYLGQWSDKDNVWLVDFFCHGVPSQQLFDKCRKYVEKKENIQITKFEFRTKKKNGATPHYYKETYEKNGEEHTRIGLYLENPFYLGFQKYITLRDSCYHCPYGSGNHVGDITIGDFHDINKYVQDINRFDGVSTVLINNDKGNHIWNLVSPKCRVWPMDIERLFSDKQIYAGGTKEPRRRAEFVSDMESMSFDEIVKKWFDTKPEWKKKLYYSMPEFIRKPLKKIAGI